MRLFFDSSVLLAAAGSTSGASRLLITSAKREGWSLLTSAYCVREVEYNLPKLGPKATTGITRGQAATCWAARLDSEISAVFSHTLDPGAA